jgi:hypothetical protein
MFQDRPDGGVLAPEAVGGAVVGEQQGEPGPPAAADLDLGQAGVDVVQAQIVRRWIKRVVTSPATTFTSGRLE